MLGKKARGSAFAVILLWFVTLSASPVTTWVPPYYASDAQTQLNANFGGYGMKDGLTYCALQFWVPNGGQANFVTRYGSINSSTVAWFANWGASNGVKVLMCVYNGENGWDWGLAANAFKNNRTAFVNSIVTQMENHGLDGVEIDIEGIGNCDGDKSAFISFISELSQAVHTRSKHLTVATYAYIWNAPNANWWPELSPLVDGISSMGYEEIGRNASGWASYSAQKANAPDPSKLMLGMPSYVGSWQGNGVTDQLDWVVNDGVVGVAIWDAALRNGSWQSGTVWQKLNTIRGTVPNDFIITASAGPNGSIDPDGVINADEGSSMTFTIEPDAGYRIDSVIVDDENKGSITSYTFSNINANHSIRCVFKRNNSVPVITNSNTEIEIIVMKPTEYILHATDSDGDRLTYGFESVSLIAISNNNEVYSFTATDSCDKEVTLTVSDGDTTVYFTLTVHARDNQTAVTGNTVQGKPVTGILQVMPHHAHRAASAGVIRFTYTATAQVHSSVLTLYDLLGNTIAILKNGICDDQNSITFQWDMLTRNGRRIGNGVYLAVITVSRAGGGREQSTVVVSID